MNLEKNSRGGGVALILKSSIRTQKSDVSKYKSFEICQACAQFENGTIQIFVVYRPPPNNKNGLTFNQFYNEFSTFLCEVVTLHQNFIICGDFNAHVNKASDRNARLFLELLESFDLKQNVDFKTHVSGNTIDLVITTKNGIQTNNIYQNDPGLSDHFAIDFSLDLAKNSNSKKEIIYRDVKGINIDSLKNDIKDIEFKKTQNVAELAQSYNENLGNVFNKHSPIVKKNGSSETKYKMVHQINS